MSTQSILQFDLLDIKNNLDEALSCASGKMILDIKFGFKNSIESKDIFLMNYLYDLINNDNNCYLISDEECSLEKINKLLLKYK